jgi:hypothetical protein
MNRAALALRAPARPLGARTVSGQSHASQPISGSGEHGSAAPEAERDFVEHFDSYIQAGRNPGHPDVLAAIADENSPVAPGVRSLPSPEAPASPAQLAREGHCPVLRSKP